MRKILEKCPSCQGALTITEVGCQTCGTEVRSQYQPCDFCALTEEQSTFVRLFVQNRGKLNAMEELLGVSYPTVSSKLEEIIGRLQASALQHTAHNTTAPSGAPSPVHPRQPEAPSAPPAPPLPSSLPSGQMAALSAPPLRRAIAPRGT